jgi:preprotein translocase subunit SecA
MRSEVVSQLVDDYVPPQSVPEQWDIEGLTAAIETQFAIKLTIQQWLDDDEQLFEDQLKLKITEILSKEYNAKSESVGEKMRLFEKQITLQILDGLWKDHLATMDHLRQGIFLRSYGGKNPRQEYKREAFALFSELMVNLQQEVIKVLSLVKIRQEDSADAIEKQRVEELAREKINFQHQAVSAMTQAENSSQSQAPAASPAAPFVREVPKVGRNDLCPCGSGKKYKQCHGKIS